MSCPVIGSNADGIPELLHTECLYPIGDVKALSSLLSNIDEAFLLKHAQLNFENAKAYQKENLKSKQINFYKTFLKDYKLS